MKIQNLFSSFFLIFLLILTGCSDDTLTSETESEEQIITVKKRVEDKDEYNHLREVIDKEQVRKAINILEKANWENAEVNMGIPPNYKFQFIYTDKETGSENFEYFLWVSPKEDQIELVASELGYVQLNKKNSAALFEIVTGEKLPALK